MIKIVFLSLRWKRYLICFSWAGRQVAVCSVREYASQPWHSLWSRHIQSKKFKCVTKMMLFVRTNKAGTMLHLTVLISTQQCFLHTQTRSRLINPCCCWHTWTLTETHWKKQPLNLLLITMNNRFMYALKMTHTNVNWLAATKFIYNVQVSP